MRTYTSMRSFSNELVLRICGTSANSVEEEEMA